MKITPANLAVLVPLALVVAACGGGSDRAPTPPLTVTLGVNLAVLERAEVALGATPSGATGSPTYAWAQDAGPAVTLADETTATPTFTAPNVPAGTGPASLTFTVTCTDGAGREASDSIDVVVAASDFLLYTTNQNGAAASDLYSYDPGTGAQHRLSLPDSGDSQVYDWVWSPDRTRVTFFDSALAVTRLMRMAPDGTNGVQLTPAMGPGDRVDDFLQAPDGGSFIYWGQVGSVASSLFSVQPDGTGTQELLPPLGNWQLIDGVIWTEDGSRIIARGILESDGPRDIISIRPDGTDRRKHSPPLVAGRESFDIRVNPTSTHIAFVADANTDDLHDLYVADLLGTSSTRVHATLSAGQTVSNYEWSPDGAKLAFTTDVESTGQDSLYVVDADGSGLQRINPPIAVGASGVGQFAWSPDSSRLAYISDELNAGVVELYTALPDGSGNMRLNPLLPAGRSVEGFAVLESASRLMYAVDLNLDDVVDVVSVEWDGQGAMELTGGFEPGAGGYAFGASILDPTYFAYVSDEDTVGTQEAFVVHVDGSGRTKLSSPMTADREVTRIDISPDESNVAYVADDLVDGEFEVYAVHRDGSSRTRLTTSVPVPASSFPQVRWSEDGALLVVHGRFEVGGEDGAYVMAPDGSGFKRLLDGAAAGSRVNQYR